MKHNWEYKQLGEIGVILTGSTPSTSVKEYYDQSDYMFVKPGDIEESGITYLKASETYISELAFNTASRKLPKHSILVTCIGTIGKVGILQQEATCNQQINAIIPAADNIYYKYLAYAISSIKSFLISKKNGPVVPIINKTQFSKFKIPVPPMEVQEQIVAELDKINETIEDCRELLRNLDALAQSLFYDYFGDPAINPKGWRIYKIKDICSVNPTKREIRIPTSSEISFLPMEDLPINARYFTPIKVKTLNEVQNSYTYFSGEDVLFAKVTPCFENGKAGIPVNLINNIGFGSSELFVLRPNFQIINREYIYSFIRTNHFVSEAIKKLSGTSGLRRVPRTVVENFQIPVPPLELQEKFAERIEQIEEQKKIVENTIAELQTLLDSRMDYWFN
ncbi:MAG: restriction endonuclease subunit S [Bacteroidales bacterium]|nr:restriction endonuclease subunit S [Bacteroidales bacterium]